MVNITQNRFRLSAEMTDLLSEFNRLVDLGCSTETIKQHFVKDELFLIAMYYRQNSIFSEDLNPSVKTIEIEYKEVENV